MVFVILEKYFVTWEEETEFLSIAFRLTSA